MKKPEAKLNVSAANTKTLAVRSNVKAGARVIIIVVQPPLTC